MRNAQGYATLFDPSQGSGVKECDTFTCGHCQHIVHTRPLQDAADAPDAGGLCKVCMRLICGPCADLGKCTPWEVQLQKFEARDRARRSYGV